MNGFAEKFRGAHLLVAGEVGIDEYLFGETRRISPEAPVPVVEVHSQSLKLGMAANVAQNVTSLGGKVSLVSLRGQDPDGERLERMVTEAGIQSAYFIDDPTRPTLRKVRVVAQKQHVVRVDYERSHVLDAKLAKRFNDSLCDRLSQVDGVIVEDYGKGLWNPDTMVFVTEAKARKIPVFVDPSRTSPLALYRQSTLMTPNVEEAESLTGLRHEVRGQAGTDKAYLKRVARKLLEVAELEHAIVTCGANGMVSLSRPGTGTQLEQELNCIPTYAREVFDVTGAGDTVIAVLALMFVSGYPLTDCMRVANAAAGLVVSRIGTCSVSSDELVREVNRLSEKGWAI
jgi:D-glycero-beta-D-manno-heptose-7-phosphate kinase